MQHAKYEYLAQKKNQGCKKITKRNTIKVDIKKTTIELFWQDLCFCLK